MVSELSFRGNGTQTNFTKWLKNLKQVGSNILITGDVPDPVSARASRNLFGREERRFRVLGLTDKTITNADARLPEETSFDDPKTWVIDQRCGERSVPQTASSVTSELDSLEANDARQLYNEIQTAISFYNEQADGLDPAELRVGIDSLFPLVQEDLPAAKRILRTLGTTIRGIHGMAHYHLRVPDDDEIVDQLMEFFDARIELRKRPPLNPEQRWYAPEIDAKTPWVEL